MSLAEKYDTENKWTEPCKSCGDEVEMCNARWEVTGPYCDGCMGWPVCSCKTRHTGACEVGGGT